METARKSSQALYKGNKIQGGKQGNTNKQTNKQTNKTVVFLGRDVPDYFLARSSDL